MTKTFSTRLTAAALSLLAAAGPIGAVQAQSVDIGVLTDYDKGGVGLSADYNYAPAFETGRWSGNWAIAGRINDDSDAWLGAGFAVQYDTTDTLFFEASFMPGYYNEGDTDLGGNLQFRSLVGVGLNLPTQNALILGIDHLSNGGIEDHNPGSEAVTLRYRIRF